MMWFGFIIGLLFLIIPLAYLLASVVGLSYLWYRVLKVKRGSDLPTCAKCGYAVRGLMGLECPECGADLREVGITTPKQRGMVSPVLFVLLWTLLLPGPSCLVSGILSAVGPKTSVPSYMLTLEPITSGEYVSVDLNHMAMFQFGGAGYSSLSVEGNASQYESLDIDPVAMTYDDWLSVPTTTTGGVSSSSSSTSTANAGSTTKPLDRQALLDMLDRAGADITRQDVMDEADELLTIIQGIPTQGLANLNPTHFTQNHTNMSYDQPAGWFLLVLLVLWIGVWVGGLVYFFRVRRKQLPEARQGRSDPARFARPTSEYPGGGPPSPPTTFQ